MISLDVTPGGLAVSSDMDGECRVWTTGNGEVRVRSEEYILTISYIYPAFLIFCYFFFVCNIFVVNPKSDIDIFLVREKFIPHVTRYVTGI